MTVINITCSTWPNALIHGCTDNPGHSVDHSNFFPYNPPRWITLDTNLNINDTKKCEYLCQKQQKEGCCWLGAHGCYWKGGDAKVSTDATDTGISVKCSATRMSLQFVNVYISPLIWNHFPFIA